VSNAVEQLAAPLISLSRFSEWRCRSGGFVNFGQFAHSRAYNVFPHRYRTILAVGINEVQRFDDLGSGRIGFQHIQQFRDFVD
jgi:hypothetical protein